MNRYYRRDTVFQNQYTIGIATTDAAEEHYLDAGYYPVSRRNALKALRWQGDATTEPFVSAAIDGKRILSRRDLVATLTRGEDITRLEVW